jgi:hypothetical protein
VGHTAALSSQPRMSVPSVLRWSSMAHLFGDHHRGVAISRSDQLVVEADIRRIHPTDHGIGLLELMEVEVPVDGLDRPLR